MVLQESSNNQSNIKKEDITYPDFKLYCKAIVIKQYGMNIKTDTQTNETELRAHKKLMHVWSTNSS